MRGPLVVRPSVGRTRWSRRGSALSSASAATCVGRSASALAEARTRAAAKRRARMCRGARYARPRAAMTPTMRSRAKTGSRSAPFTAASVSASIVMQRAEAVFGPALQVALGALHLPRREAELRGELAGAAACAVHLGHRADLHGERRDDRHRILTGARSPAAGS